jgi:hypothetical protein
MLYFIQWAIWGRGDAVFGARGVLWAEDSTDKSRRPRGLGAPKRDRDSRPPGVREHRNG